MGKRIEVILTEDSDLTLKYEKNVDNYRKNFSCKFNFSKQELKHVRSLAQPHLQNLGHKI